MTAVLLLAMHLQCLSVTMQSLPGHPVVAACFYDNEPIGSTVTLPRCGDVCNFVTPDRPQVRI